MTAESTTADPRRRIIDAALRLLSETGPESVKVRAVAQQIGASTMAVYTHFGGMPDLMDAIAREGFDRFAACFDAVAETDEPLIDLLRMGLAYRDFALQNPQLYRLMFGLTSPGTRRRQNIDVIDHAWPSAIEEGKAAFGHLVRVVVRVHDSGLGVDIEKDPVAGAGQLWSVMHGYVLLETAGYFGASHGVDVVLKPLFVSLAVGYGQTLDQARASANAAFDR